MDIFKSLIDYFRLWPNRSLLFFLVSSGFIGWMALHGPFQTLWITLAVPAAVGILPSAYFSFVPPSSRLKNQATLIQIKDSFIGREESSRELARLIHSFPQFWVDGESGSGKSSLFQKAVVPLLLQSGSNVVYVNSCDR